MLQKKKSRSRKIFPQAEVQAGIITNSVTNIQGGRGRVDLTLVGGACLQKY